MHIRLLSGHTIPKTINQWSFKVHCSLTMTADYPNYFPRQILPCADTWERAHAKYNENSFYVHNRANRSRFLILIDDHNLITNMQIPVWQAPFITLKKTSHIPDSLSSFRINQETDPTLASNPLDGCALSHQACPNRQLACSPEG